MFLQSRGHAWPHRRPARPLGGRNAQQGPRLHRARASSSGSIPTPGPAFGRAL